MDFGLSQDQESLREAARSFLRSEASLRFSREMLDHPRGITDDVWRSLADLGWIGLAIPEEHGGSGLGLLELVLVLEEAGAVALPGPFLSTVSFALPLVLATADPAQVGALVPEVLAGRRLLATAIPERSGRYRGRDIRARAVRDGSSFVLTGEKRFAPDAAGCDTLIVAARLDEGLGFFALPAELAGLTIEPMQTVDRTQRLAVVRLDAVRVEEPCLLGARVFEDAVLDGVVDRAKVALCADMVGAATQALAMTVDYVQMREQFGRAIATFQAIQHRCADMKVAVENSRSLAYYAAWAADAKVSTLGRAAAAAKAYASEACPRVAADAIQLHGGIGFTWEHDLHILFKRLRAAEAAYGDAVANREIVAASLENES